MVAANKPGKPKMRALWYVEQPPLVYETTCQLMIFIQDFLLDHRYDAEAAGAHPSRMGIPNPQMAASYQDSPRHLVDVRNNGLGSASSGGCHATAQ